jgi:hypothetical protein
MSTKNKIPKGKDKKEGESNTTGIDKLPEMLAKLSGSIESINKRISDLENKNSNDKFKIESKEKDIIKAAEMNENVPKNIVNAIHRILGEDIGIKVDSFENQPGFQLTLFIPERLSSIKRSERPKVDKNGNYIKDKNGVVILEEWWAGDKRTRSIPNNDDIVPVIKWAEKVRSHIVATFNKLQKPIPEFKIKV